MVRERGWIDGLLIKHDLAPPNRTRNSPEFWEPRWNGARFVEALVEEELVDLLERREEERVDCGVMALVEKSGLGGKSET